MFHMGQLPTSLPIVASIQATRATTLAGRGRPQRSRGPDQGVALGNRSNNEAAGAMGRKSAKDKASAFASNVMPIVSSTQATGVTTSAGIADALIGRGVRTARGGRRWYVSTVMNLPGGRLGLSGGMTPPI